MKFAAFGRTSRLYRSIEALRSRGHELVLVGTTVAQPESEIKETHFEAIAQDAGCPYFCDPNINKYVRLAQDSRAEVAISVNWLTLIGNAMIDAFPRGIINAHAGDLPRFRGNATANWAILTGESNIVLTLHRMAEQLDAGDILCQRSLAVTPQTYIRNVLDFTEQAVPEMFVEVLDGLRAGTLKGKPQPTDPALSLRCFPRLPRDSEIDWERSADDIARLVRASAEPLEGAYTHAEAERVTVWRARSERLDHPHLGAPGQLIERRRNGEVVVLTGDGMVVLEEIQTPSHGRCRPADVFRSIRLRLGMDVASEVEHLRRKVADLERLVRELTARLR